MKGVIRFGEGVAAIAAHTEDIPTLYCLQGLQGSDTHHGSAVCVEAHCHRNGQTAGGTSAFNGRFGLVQVAHRFNPEDVYAAFSQGSGLFGKSGFGFLKGHSPHRVE